MQLMLQESHVLDFDDRSYFAGRHCSDCTGSSRQECNGDNLGTSVMISSVVVNG
jgi:hypothetical protein